MPLPSVMTALPSFKISTELRGKTGVVVVSGVVVVVVDVVVKVAKVVVTPGVVDSVPGH